MKVFNLKTQKFDSETGIYIGRANEYYGFECSKWSNPFILKNESERDYILKQYREYIMNNNHLLNSLPELYGKDLYCYCSPKKCHGNVLIELCNEKKYNEFVEITISKD